MPDFVHSKSGYLATFNLATHVVALSIASHCDELVVESLSAAFADVMHQAMGRFRLLTPDDKTAVLSSLIGDIGLFTRFTAIVPAVKSMTLLWQLARATMSIVAYSPNLGLQAGRRDFLQREFASTAQPLIVAILARIAAVTPVELKKLPLGVLYEVFKFCEVALNAASGTEVSQSLCTPVRVQIALTAVQCPVLEVKLEGVRELNEFARTAINSDAATKVSAPCWT